jgi:hypothetical protein
MKLRVTLILFIALIQITPDRVRAQDSGSALQRLQDLRGQLMTGGISRHVKTLRAKHDIVSRDPQGLRR